MSTLRSFSAISLGMLALPTLSCVPEFDTDLTRITQPRLIAISSSPAETQPQEETTLSALVAVPEGQPAPRIDWTMCLDRKPLTELGPVNPSCLEPDDGSGKVQSLGHGLEVSATLDKEVCKLFGPLRPSPMGAEATGRPVDPDITGGFYQPIAASIGGVVSLGAVRIDCDLANVGLEDAITYRQRYRANENPRITSLLSRAGDAFIELSEERLVVAAGQRLALRAMWNECSAESTCGDGLCTAFEDGTTCAEDCGGERRGCTGAEPYYWFNRESQRVEERREAITVAWYTSQGHFENEQTGLAEEEAASSRFSDNFYVASDQPGTGTIWIVIRDSRGGQSWQVVSVEVKP